jgi:hypothetical protein
MFCYARVVRSRNYENAPAMFRDALAHRKKLFKIENKRTKYYCIVFVDDSRLTFKLQDDEFFLMSWFYYV